MAVACPAAAAETRLTESNQHPWYALRVRARHEELVASALTHKGYEILLPQYRCLKQWSDRIKAAQLPLFPGYLFGRFDINHRLPLLVTPGVLHIVSVGREFIPVDPDEMAAIERLVASGAPAEPTDFLRVGEKVRIAAGPLRGVEGLLVHVNERRRLVLSVSLLQRSVSVEISRDHVLPVEESRRVLGFSAWAPQAVTA